MKSPVAFASFWPRSARRVLIGAAVMALPALAGCPGSLEGEFPPVSSNPDGAPPDSSSSGGATASGGTVGTGGTVASTGGMVGSGGVTATGGVVGTGGMTAGTGGKAGAMGGGGKSGTGGMVGTGGHAGGSTGHGGTMGGGGSGALANCDAPTMIFKSSTVGCIDGGCHGAASGSQKPDLQTADPTVLKAYKTSVLCNGGMLVVPSNPTSSVLYKVVDGMSCGAQMPVGKPALSTAQKTCLAGWIANLP